MSPPRPDLSDLLTALDPDAPLAQRHLWLIGLLAWVRGQGNDSAASVARVQLLLDAASARPEWLLRWQAWWRALRRDVDIAHPRVRSVRPGEVHARGRRHRLAPEAPRQALGDGFAVLGRDKGEQRLADDLAHFQPEQGSGLLIGKDDGRIGCLNDGKSVLAGFDYRAIARLALANLHFLALALGHLAAQLVVGGRQRLRPLGDRKSVV